MLAASGIAMPDHFHSILCKENRVLVPIAHNICALGAKELWRGLSTTGGKKKQDQQDTHWQRLPPRR